MKIHMLGIKGSGMSALAIILKQLGNEISGSDVSCNMFTEEELEKNDIYVRKFDEQNLKDVDLLIVGHKFIDSDNVEIMSAKRKKIMVVEYNKFLKEFIEGYYSVAICGSNGKSTTTALIATILDEVENTSYLIGSGEGKGSANSKYFTFEACEHKKHFLEYNPSLILVNNIDYDHVDFYKNEEEYKNAFYAFINKAKDRVVVNGDDENLNKLNNVIFFGINNKEMFNARNINYENGIDYDLYYKDNFISHIHLNLYGEYMVYDTLAAISVTLAMGIEINVIINALKKFKGVKRRFKETIINDDVYIDDYAHHPSKIKAMISATRMKYKDKKIIAFYRPDRITRLDYFSFSFANELLKADKAYILPFISKTEEEEKCIERFLVNNPKIKKVNESIYKRMAKEKGVVYLMMSSKDVSEVKEEILKYKR